MFTVSVGEWFKTRQYEYVNDHLANFDDPGLIAMTIVF